MMVGFAWQKGWIDLDLPAFEAAVTLNGTAVAMNLSAFAWGRRLAAEPETVLVAAGMGRDPQPEDVVQPRSDFLADYQDPAYAERFRATVARVTAAEHALGGSGALADTVAKGLFRVMAYKDEYEVARLYAEAGFSRALGEAFEGDVKLTFHLAPPILSRRDKATGHLRKRAFGGWMLPVFRFLAKGRGLRGTAFDPFGRTAERRAERQLILDYEQLVENLLAGLSADRLEEATRIAAMVLEVRGYGHVKDAAMARYYGQVTPALAAYQAKPDRVQSLQLAG